MRDYLTLFILVATAYILVSAVYLSNLYFTPRDIDFDDIYLLPRDFLDNDNDFEIYVRNTAHDDSDLDLFARDDIDHGLNAYLAARDELHRLQRRTICPHCGYYDAIAPSGMKLGCARCGKRLTPSPEPKRLTPSPEPGPASGLCVYPHCTNKVYTSGYCTKHRSTAGICSNPICETPTSSGHKFCAKHRQSATPGTCSYPGCNRKTSSGHKFCPPHQKSNPK